VVVVDDCADDCESLLLLNVAVDIKCNIVC